MNAKKKENAAIVGVGVAACAVCCAGPILAVLAAIGLGTAAGFALFGDRGGRGRGGADRVRGRASTPTCRRLRNHPDAINRGGRAHRHTVTVVNVASPAHTETTERSCC